MSLEQALVQRITDSTRSPQSTGGFSTGLAELRTSNGPCTGQACAFNGNPLPLALTVLYTYGALLQEGTPSKGDPSWKSSPNGKLSPPHCTRRVAICCEVITSFCPGRYIIWQLSGGSRSWLRGGAVATFASPWRRLAWPLRLCIHLYVPSPPILLA